MITSLLFPEEKFIQKREITIDSYSETISSDISSSECIITADSDSSATSSFKETLCKLDMDTKGIETTLQQIASGLQSATEGYLTLASHISGIAPYELPQVIAQIPPPPMDVHMLVRKALMVDGENKVVDYSLHGEYELNKLLGLNYRKSITLVGIRCMPLSKEKEDQEVPNIAGRRRNKELKWKLQHPILTP